MRSNNFIVKILVPDGQRGLVRVNGRVREWLSPGVYYRWALSRSLDYELIQINAGYISASPELESIIPSEEARAVDIGSDELAVVSIRGAAVDLLRAGRYLIFTQGEVQVHCYNTNEVLVSLPRWQAAVFDEDELKELIVDENQRALLHVDGNTFAFLEPGRHVYFKGKRNISVTRLYLQQGFTTYDPRHEAFIPVGLKKDLAVAPNEVAILELRGQPMGCLAPGNYVLWQEPSPVVASKYSLEGLLCEVPIEARHLVPAKLATPVVVKPYERALVYSDGELAKVLDAGNWFLNAANRKLNVQLVDLREEAVQIVGQELMSSDKVTLRVNVVAKVEVKDPVLAVESTVDYKAALYTEAQMIVRRFVASVTVDTLLGDRNAASLWMQEELAKRATSWGVEVKSVDIKDVILPGEMRTLMQRVLSAEKEAEAGSIERREESARTRSQANAARMIENNPVMMRLRELEALQTIAASVEQLTVVATPEELLKKLGQKLS